MSLIYITGIAGSGKSTVLEELRRRGYETYDADDNLSAWEHKVTRERVLKKDLRLPTEPKFFEEHDWYMDREGVKKLAQRASNKTIYLCGSVANEPEVWENFSKVICLYVDDETLKQRIQNRTSKSFGKSKHEFEHLLKLNNEVQRKYTSLGAILLNSDMPTSELADKITQLTGA